MIAWLINFSKIWSKKFCPAPAVPILFLIKFLAFYLHACVTLFTNSEITISVSACVNLVTTVVLSEFTQRPNRVVRIHAETEFPKFGQHDIVYIEIRPKRIRSTRFGQHDRCVDRISVNSTGRSDKTSPNFCHTLTRKDRFGLRVCRISDNSNSNLA